jgi:hypothetical protein
MNAICLKTRVEGDTLRVPELKQWIGKEVKVVITEETPAEPAPMDLSALRKVAEDIASGKLEYDFDALQQLRGASMI